MIFNRNRITKLAGLIRESREEVYEVDHPAMDESDLDESDLDESDYDETVEETYEIDENDLKELEESFDLRRVIRNEIAKSIKNRDERTYEWTTGQVHGRKTRAKVGGVTMGFPGIGFRR